MVDIRELTKSYGGVHALRGVSLDIRPGEVHALCGENGAGKSTLIKCLTGVVTPDAGEIRVNDKLLAPGSVRASEAAGIAVIHQEPTVFPDLDAADNIFVGREPRRCGGLLLNRAVMRARTRELLARLGEDIDISRPARELSLAKRQMVAMARAISLECHTLILDEPTASLSARETRTLMEVIRGFRGQGMGILYVSHRLEEIFELADRVTVLRDGEYVDTRPVADTGREELIRLMVGREVDELAGRRSAAARPPSEVALRVEGLTRHGVFSDISFTVARGEILGLGGLVGAGRSEVARAVFGVDSYDEGRVLRGDEPVRKGSVAAAMDQGIALIPEDRRSQGLELPMSVADNLSLSVLPSLTRFGMISAGREAALVRDLMADLRIKAASPEAPAETLSGGNRQKIVIGKWLAAKPTVLLLDEPTRGVDVGAKAEVHRLVRRLAADGAAVVLISSDLPELLALSDRILVLREGRISGELAGAAAGREAVLALALPDGTATEAEGAP